MTVKEYLSQAWKMDRKLRVLLGKVEELRSLLDYRSPSLEGSGSGESADRVPDTLASIIEYERRAQELQEQLIDKFFELDRAIKSVPEGPLREVLERRYLLYQKWEKIADEMHFTERRVFQLHGEALKKISLNFSIDV